MKVLLSFWFKHDRSFLNGIRAALGAALSAVAAEKLHLHFPIYAVIAAVVVIEASTRLTMRAGVQRLFGTFIGAIAGWAGALFFPGNLFVMAASVFLMFALCSLLRFEIGAKIAAYIPPVVILSYSGNPLDYAWNRFAETAIGIGFGILISVLFEVCRISPREDPVG